MVKSHSGTGGSYSSIVINSITGRIWGLLMPGRAELIDADLATQKCTCRGVALKRVNLTGSCHSAGCGVHHDMSIIPQGPESN